MNNSIYRLTSVLGAFSLLCGQMYAFIGANSTLNIVVNCRPFSEPGDGVMYERFADDALYSINLANPVTGALLMTYNFRFSPVSSAAGSYKNLNTILSYGRGTGIGAIQTLSDAQQNFTQTYSVTLVNGVTSATTVLGSSFTVPPPNTGLRITPAYNGPSGFAISGATTPAGLDSYTQQAIFTAPTGEKV